MFPWWLHTKRFGLKPTFQDESRWQKRGNVYTLRKPDQEKDKWVTSAHFKSTQKLKPDERLKIRGTANANIIDRVQERLDPRGLDANDYLRNPQLLAHHSYYMPIGQVEVLDPQEDGVHFDGWVGDPAAVGGPEHLTAMQHEMRSLIAQRILKTVSVGFIPHKFRAPLYNDSGEMEEPLVIEKWELLELSVVAVPCNQLSLFEVRDVQDQKEKRFWNLGALPLNGKPDDALKFLSENFTKEEIISLAQSLPEPVQAEASPDNDDSDEGENVTVKTKGAKPAAKTEGSEGASGTGAKGEGEEDNEEENYEKEVITLLRTMNAGQQKTLELCGEMMKRLMGDDAAPTEGDDEEDEEEKAAQDAVEKRIAALENGQKEIVEAIKSLAQAVAKK